MSIAYDHEEWANTPHNVPTETAPQGQLHPAILAYQRAKKTIQELETFVKWEDELFANPNFSGNHKLQIRATKRAVQKGQTKDDAGRTRINLTTIADQIGVSPATMGRGLKFLKKAGIIPDHEMVPEVQENGERWTRHYVTLDEELLAKPKEIVPPAARNHGGVRYTCRHCGSEDVKIRKRTTIICKCCHNIEVIEETEHDQLTGQQDASRVESEATRKNFDVLASNLQDIIKPVSPPICDTDDAISTGYQDASRLDETVQPDTNSTGQHLDSRDENEDMDDLQAAAELLLAIAGQADEHIEMSRKGESKYYTVKRPLAKKDALDHLQGGKARGALCQQEGDQTRALSWDADNDEGWQMMQESARSLTAVGYLPILEPSPAGRGGHLWIVFDGLIAAAVARQHIYSQAPQLADLKEYWPGPRDARRWNKVRLPGGKYVRPGVNAWCQLVSVATGETSSNGVEAARLLLTHQTSVQIVPTVPASDEQFDQEEGAAPPECTEFAETAVLTNPDLDQQWQQKYGHGDGLRLWFSFSPAYVASWFNAQTAPQDLLPADRRGFGTAEWRGERTGSVAFRGDQWTDFGATARREDGSQDSGDALELKTRLDQTPKPEVLRQAAKDLVREARAALESAARNGEAIPAWLEEIITPAGQAHYAKLCSGSHETPTDQQVVGEHEQGGLTGFSTPKTESIASHMPVIQVGRQPKKSGVAVPHEFLDEHHLTHVEEPCKNCGCELTRELDSESVCVRCYPPRGYSVMRDQIDSWYPRRRSL